MGSIVIKLDPRKLTNPDADLRYRVPDAICELTSRRVWGVGYDYLDEPNSIGGPVMAIFLECADDDIEGSLASVLEILKTTTFIDNQLGDVAEVLVSDMTDKELEAHDYHGLSEEGLQSFWKQHFRVICDPK